MFKVKSILVIGCLAFGLFMALESSSSAAPSSGPIVIRITHAYSVGHMRESMAQKMKQLCAAKFGNRVQVTSYPAAQLFKSKEEPEAIRTGAVEMALSINPFAYGFVPAYEMYDLPFGFLTLEDNEKFVHSENGGKALNKLMEPIGIKLLASHYIGATGVGTRKKKINNMDDIKGLKIRTIGAFTEIIKHWKASAVSISEAELATAIQQGMVDGYIQTYTGAQAGGFLDFTKYYWMVDTRYGYGHITANLKWWNSLPPDIQKPMENEIIPAVVKYGNEVLLKQEEDFKVKCAEKKIELTYPTKEEKIRLKELVKPMYDELKPKVPPQVWAEAARISGVPW